MTYEAAADSFSAYGKEQFSLPSLRSSRRPAAAQEGAEPGDPMRIVIMVDNSQTPLDPLPQIRRGLQQFVDALPPNHELMLVTTGGR